jgi:uncharacterized protein (TIGR02266 family)
VVRVEVRLADRSEWIRVFDPRDFTMFVTDDAPPNIGQAVRIDLFIGSPGPRIILRGQIISRRTKGDSHLPRGFSAALGVEERAKINWLTGYVRGGMIDLREKRRLPIRLKVAYTDGDGPQIAYSRDVNDEGIFVITKTPIAEDRAVELMVTIPGNPEPIELGGVVSHTVVVEDEDVPGMGIRFELEGRIKERFTAIIDKLEKRFFEGKLPDDCLL